MAESVAAAKQEITELETKASVFGSLPERPNFRELMQGMNGLKRVTQAREDYLAKLRAIVEAKAATATAPASYTQISKADADLAALKKQVAEWEASLTSRSIPFKAMPTTGTEKYAEALAQHHAQLRDLIISSGKQTTTSTPKMPSGPALSAAEIVATYSGMEAKERSAYLQRPEVAAVLGRIITEQHGATGFERTLAATKVKAAGGVTGAFGQVMDRKTFDALSPAMQRDFCAEGGRLIDTDTPERPKLPAGQCYRDEYMRMSRDERSKIQVIHE